jgi:uncharacterized protein
MALLIDGYNLLHATDIFGAAGPGTDLHRSRVALLNFLAAAIDERERTQTTIVFDAAGAPPGLPRTLTHAGMTVFFARRHANADEMIEELLEHSSGGRSLLVVSSDHRVQRAARRCGASFIDSEAWYAELRDAARATDNNAENTAKAAGEVPPQELAYWLREFDAAPADAENPLDPFPPGYAEDVSEE